MSETDTLGASLSPEENAFFESGGETAIQALKIIDENLNLAGPGAPKPAAC